MDPRAQSCPNPRCPARGRAGPGHITVHSDPERRYRCTTCRTTRAATTGPPFYRLPKDAARFGGVVPPLADGCPTQAIVAAFGREERTVGAGPDRAGGHAQGLHHHSLSTSPVDRRHVPADAICGRTGGGRCGRAMALAVPTRPWLGGVVSPIRELGPIQRLVARVRLAGKPGGVLLIGVDGRASDVTAFRQAVRERAYPGRRGRPPDRLPKGVRPGQVVKEPRRRRLVGVVRRVVRGRLGRINRVLRRTGTGQQITTSYIERLHATFRSRRASLVRRGRGSAHRVKALELGLDLGGGVSNCWTEPRRLRVSVAGGGAKWRGRTPAMAARGTDRVWSVRELLAFRPPTLVHA